MNTPQVGTSFNSLPCRCTSRYVTFSSVLQLCKLSCVSCDSGTAASLPCPAEANGAMSHQWCLCCFSGFKPTEVWCSQQCLRRFCVSMQMMSLDRADNKGCCQALRRGGAGGGTNAITCGEVRFANTMRLAVKRNNTCQANCMGVRPCMVPTGHVTLYLLDASHAQVCKPIQ